ncbi:MAG: fibronectin type III domain-containing protein, partial [Actinomycetota bacterium]|nr:fibronectin type III domain-containing protein [Actinomycetota bacterium]
MFEPRFRRIAGVVLGVVTAGAALGVAVPPPAFAATAPTISSGVAAYTPSSTPGAPAGTPLASQFDVLTLVSGGAASVNTSSLYVVTTPSSGSVSATPSASNGIITFQPSSTTSGPQILQFAYCSPGYTYPNSTACTTSTLTFEPVASIQAVGESLSVGGSDAVVVQNVGMAVTGPASLPIGSTVSLSVASAPEQVPSTVPYGTGSISVTSLAGMTDIIPVPSGLSYVQGSLSVTGGDSTTSGQLTVTYCTASGTGCTAQLGVGNYQTTAPYFELALPSTTTVPAGSQYTVPTVTAQFTVSGTAGSVADLALTETMAGVTVQNGVSAQPLAFDGYPTSIGTTADPPPYQMPTPMFTGTIAAVPGQPAITSLLPGNAQVTVGWNPPSTTGGNSITGYVITWYVAGSVAGSTSVGNLASTTIGNLTDGTAYTFTVAATNSVGTGPASSPDGPVDPFTTPGAPTIGTAVAGNTEATVAWTVGPDNGALIESYTITPYIGTTAQTPVVVNAVAGTSTDPTPGYSDSYVITGLTNGTAYTFVVSESNLAGASQTSFASNAVTPAVSITPPSAPTIGVASAGKGTATVTWTVGSDNGAVISDFVITPYIGVTAQAPLTITAGAVGSSTDPTPNAQDSTTISGLTNGTTYSFTVAATNSGGTGQPSALSNLVTPYTVPSTITIGTAVAGSSSATVAWKVGSDGGSAITYFIITPYANGVAQATVNVPAVSGSSTSPTQGSSDSFVLSGLVDGTSYSFRVRAVNAAGTSLYSAASNTVTPATVPGAPTIGTATSGNTQATVTWTVGPNNGSAITSFTVTPYVG